MGVDIALAALAAGRVVVATGSYIDAVTNAIGETDDLLVIELDIKSPASAVAAVQSASECFGCIDVLVNNAGNFFAGFFEELSPEQFEAQLWTYLLGPLNVTRAVLPLMRKQRSGHVVTISSTAGIVGQEFCSAYAARSSAWRDGWSRCASSSSRSASTPRSSSQASSAPTLTKHSTAYADLSIDVYAERTAQTRPAWEAMSGSRPRPRQARAALLTLVDQQPPPLRWVTPADALATVATSPRPPRAVDASATSLVPP